MEEKTARRNYSLFPIPYSLFLAAFIALTLPACQPGKEKAKPPVRLGPEIKQLAEEVLSPIEGPVAIEIYRGGTGETSGEEAQALVDLLAGISTKVSVNKLDILTDAGDKDLGVSHGPVTEMKGSAPGTLRYYGYPERKEVRPFLEGILTASGHAVDLPPKVASFISALDEEIWIRIFTTPD